MTGLVATAQTEVDAAPERVWSALVDPALIKQYMFGTTVHSDWRVGTPITWEGEYEGRSYQDKGEIVELEPNRRLSVTHYSPLSGAPDVPASYHTVTYELAGHGGHTHVTLNQDNNSSQEEAEHSAANWQMMLDGLKRVVEGG